MKKKSGITLIALVITIIVLLILAVVSINAVVGDNGVISNAIESKIVTAIANIIFDVESNVVDINTDNILEKRKIIATEMMKKLEEKNILKSGLNTDLFLKGSTSLMQSEINDNRLVPVDLSYNGDVWYNNYKRGKILLSSQTNTIYSTNGRTKITVIDGTVEEVIENYKYYLRGLEDRDDFVCWVNGYGEIVSPYKNTVVYINIPREEEFTAIYDEDIKNGLDLRYYNIKDYIEKMLSDEEESFGKCLIGLSSNLIQGDDGNLNFEEQCTHNTYSHFYQGEMDDEPLYNLGAEVYGMDIMMSDNYEDLTTDDNGVFKGLEYIEETGEYAIPENMILMEHDYINAELISEEYNEEYNIDKANFDEISLLSDESEKNSPEINIKDIKNNDDTLDSDYDVDLDVYGTIDEVAKLLWDKKYDYGFFTIGNYYIKNVQDTAPGGPEERRSYARKDGGSFEYFTLWISKI